MFYLTVDEPDADFEANKQWLRHSSDPWDAVLVRYEGHISIATSRNNEIKRVDISDF
jgi:hypothetical protein